MDSAETQPSKRTKASRAFPIAACTPFPEAFGENRVRRVARQLTTPEPTWPTGRELQATPSPQEVMHRSSFRLSAGDPMLDSGESALSRNLEGFLQIPAHTGQSSQSLKILGSMAGFSDMVSSASGPQALSASSWELWTSAASSVGDGGAQGRDTRRDTHEVCLVQSAQEA